MSSEPNILKVKEPLKLERGEELSGLEIGYHTYGKLNKAKDNVVWVFHALTANSDCLDWWGDLLNEKKFLSPEKYFIVCANILGSPYGTTSPLSVNPETKKPYYSDFPLITIRDMVACHKLLQKELGIQKITIGIGGSMGGFQTYEWAVQEPELFDKLILIGTAPKESPWRIAIHASQRLAIEADPTWKDESVTAGAHGVATSRAIGMLTYRNHKIFEKTQLDEEEKVDDFKSDSYVRYQGEKLVKRDFQGYLLWMLTKALDSHDLGRDRGGLKKALSQIKADVLQIAIKSDVLFPLDEQRRVSTHTPNVTFRAIDSLYGHDGFLTESKEINSLIKEFLK